ncbi:MAG: FAD-dependent monooxygenase, partial [Acidimicrobiia bacterium]|nr:FAD-dependent monooxygenase [Acidimicrobiia bacterium]
MAGLKIAVVGGSLGGLTAACLLRDSGHDVRVFERSPRQLEQRGAGIGFLRATYKYLVERAGVDLSTISIATEHIRHLGRDGSVLHDDLHRYLFSSWNTVYRALLDHWGAGSYLLGHELVDFDETGDEVHLRFGNGHRDTVDLLVCADGVGSLSRRRLQPDADAGYAGYVAWRGMVPESDLPPDLAAELGDAITYYVYANSHILVYPIPGLDGSVHPGDRLVNFVWYRNYAEGGDLDNLLTDRHGERRELSIPPGAVAAHHDAEARATAAARLPATLAEVVARTEDLFVQVVYDIEVERMAFGRVCLLGDAAFAVRPHAAAGTAKAADDGWALDAALSSSDDVPGALERWEA